MRKDQCLFCTSRKCSTRIVTTDDNGKMYDEVSCSKHVRELEKDADTRAHGVMKLHMSSTGGVKRCVSIANDLKEMER